MVGRSAGGESGRRKRKKENGPKLIIIIIILGVEIYTREGIVQLLRNLFCDWVVCVVWSNHCVSVLHLGKSTIVQRGSPPGRICAGSLSNDSELH